MTKQIQFIQVTPEQLQNAIIDGVNSKLEELKINFEPKTPNVYMSRAGVSDMLGIDQSSVSNWRKRGILQAYQIAGRVYYKRDEVERAIVKLKR